MKNRKQFMWLAVLAGALSVSSTGFAEGWLQEMADAKPASLGDLVRSPREYVEVPVRVKVVFHQTGSTYNPYFTRFTTDVYANFSAWPENARLYEKRDYERAYPFFFVQRFNPAFKKLRTLRSVTPVEVVAVVRDVFRGQPWIEVIKFSEIEGLRQADVKSVVSADACFVAGRYGDATKRYAEAAGNAENSVVKADLHRRAGDAAYADGNYSEALWHYQAGLSVAPESAVLKQGVLAARQARDHDKMVRAGRKSAGISEIPAPSAQPVLADMSNDVDAYLAHFDDPAKVSAQVEADRASLVRRGELARGGRDATVAVPAEAPAEEQPKEAAVVEEQPAVEEGQPVAAEQPAVEGEPVVEEQPVAPVEEGSEVPQPSQEEPAAVEGQPSAEAPVEEQPASDQPADEQPASGEAVEEQPAQEAPVSEQPASEQPAAEEPVAEQPANEQPANEQPANEQSANEQPAAEQPVAEQPVAEQPAAEQPAAEEPVVAEEPAVAEVPANEQPAAEEGCAPCGSETAPEEAPVAEGVPAEEAPAAEGCAPVAEEGCAEAAPVAEGEPAANEAVTEVAVEEAEGEVAAAVEVTEEPKAVRLPRLPFFGCDGVTMDQLRAILEEIAATPEQS